MIDQVPNWSNVIVNHIIQNDRHAYQYDLRGDNTIQCDPREDNAI